MGVQFFLIDRRAPLGALHTCNSMYPNDRYSHDRMFRRLRESVQNEETIASVVTRILNHCRPHSLDVMRIFTHGPRPSNETRENPDWPIELGAGLHSQNAAEFRRIRHLWSRRYEGRFPGQRRMFSSDERYRHIIPRIEMHTCFVVDVSQPALRALARAARAPVFASRALQVYNTRNDNLNIEGAVRVFEPFSG